MEAVEKRTPVLSGMRGFTIIWIGSGKDAVITSRLMTFIVALGVAIISTYAFKKRKV